MTKIKWDESWDTSDCKWVSALYPSIFHNNGSEPVLHDFKFNITMFRRQQTDWNRAILIPIPEVHFAHENGKYKGSFKGVRPIRTDVKIFNMIQVATNYTDNRYLQ